MFQLQSELLGNEIGLLQVELFDFLWQAKIAHDPRYKHPEKIHVDDGIYGIWYIVL